MKFKGIYNIGGHEIPNMVSSHFEKDILNSYFKDTSEITSVTIKCGQIVNPFDKQTQLTDIIESGNYTPVTLQIPSATDWDVVTDESLAYSIRTRELNFAVTGECRYNCFFIVDQDNNLLSVSGRLSSVVTKNSDFTGYYKFYCL